MCAFGPGDSNALLYMAQYLLIGYSFLLSIFLSVLAILLICGGKKEGVFFVVVLFFNA